MASILLEQRRKLFSLAAWLSVAHLFVASVAAPTEDGLCTETGEAAPIGSNLLQVSSSRLDEEDRFGPGRCVSLARNPAGSCVIRTKCDGKNISGTAFVFVCINEGTSQPHALHDFGIGSFAPEETHDTEVKCQKCTSVDSAFRTGGPMVKNALAALPLSRLPSLSVSDHGSTLHSEPGYSATELASFKSQESAVYGPVGSDGNHCIEAFKSPGGTCLIRTKCAGADLSKFNVGITCVDKSGGYTRYLFGKDTFKAEETFDTLVSCERCLGVGKEASTMSLHGLIPRKLVEDVGSLKTDVQTLHEKVRVLSEGGSPKEEKKKEEKKEKEFLMEDPDVPTIMLSRNGDSDSDAPVTAVEVQSPSLADASASDGAFSGGAIPAPAPLQVVSHRRKGRAIAELLKLAGQK